MRVSDFEMKRKVEMKVKFNLHICVNGMRVAGCVLRRVQVWLTYVCVDDIFCKSRSWLEDILAICVNF